MGLVVGLVGAGQAQAAFPGENGKIAFTSNRDDGNHEVYAMDADGLGQTNLTNHPSFDFEPAWSPDGQKIAFSTVRDGDLEVYVMSADGSGQTNLSNHPAESDNEPAWSPDGQRIAFSSTRDRGPDWQPNPPDCDQDTGGAQEQGPVSGPLHGVDEALGSESPGTVGRVLHSAICNLLVPAGL